MDNVAMAISWDDHKRWRRCAVGVSAALIAASLAPALVGAGARASSALVSVIVRGSDHDGGVRAASAVQRAGGTVQRSIGLIDGVAATVPADRLGVLSDQPGVREVTPNGRVRLQSIGSYDPAADATSLFNTTLGTGAQAFWKAGYTGKGVGVALIDSGVAPVPGINVANVVNGPDLSFESQAPNLIYTDTFGHGTHMAGIIAGHDSGAVPGAYAGDTSNFLGMAPDARIVSLKVADAHGVADVSQILAAIDWVVQRGNNDDQGFNIKVLNLSFGTDSTQPYTLDPLAFAVERAWQRGIVVVAAAGNSGSKGTTGITDPAMDPYVIAVGAADTHGTLTQADDSVAPFSAIGTAARTPDLVAPGVSVTSLAVPGSYIAQTFSSTGAVGSRFFRGSGTSQATAVVTGAAALLLSKSNYTPDQVKAILTSTATPLAGATQTTQGAGEVNLQAALTAKTPQVSQSWPESTGTGTLEGSRGSYHVGMNNVVLTGEQDIFGAAVNTSRLANLESCRQAWTFTDTKGYWNGNAWTGAGFGGSSWAASTWSASTWSGSTWSGSTWSAMTWSGNTWSGTGWTGSTWSGNTWSANTWSGSTWSANTWSGNTWSGSTWSASSWS